MESRRGHALGDYLAALALVAAAAVAGGLAGPSLSEGGTAMVFLLSVLISAVGLGLGPALLAALAASLGYNLLFLEPRYTLRIAHPSDLLTFAVFFAVALATGWSAGRVRDQARTLARRAALMETLLEASRTLSAAATPDAAAQALADQAAGASGGAAIVLRPDGADLQISGGPPGLDRLSPASLDAARQVWKTETPLVQDSAQDWSFRALQGLHGRVGVIGLRGAPAAGSEADRLLAALLHQGAVALERAELADAAAENAALRKSDLLRGALLNSISHDLRTPLSTVLGSATTLIDFEKDLKPAVRRDLLDSIREAAQRLNRYVGDLLDMSRLEGGALAPRQIPTDVREVLAQALAGIGDQLGQRKVRRDFPPKLSLVKLDPRLLEQTLLNVVGNAAAYSPDGSTLEVAAYEDLDNVVIAVEDQGPGIPAEALESVFDKFRRLEQPSDRGQGLGLGLAIAKGFIEAMGGRIAAVSPVADGRGTRILISIPKGLRMPRELL